MRAAKEVARQKIISAHDLINCHPFTPELATELFRLKPDTSNSHEFELHRPSNKGTKLLLKVIKAIIIIITSKGMGVFRFSAALIEWSIK